MLETALTFRFEVMAKIGYQVEVCRRFETGGLLAGRFARDRVRVLSPVTARNEAKDPQHAFAIGAEQMAELVCGIESEGLELLGSYHSHPNGNAQMSSADAAMAQSTGMLLIVAPAPAWQWRLWDPVAGGEVGFAIEPPRA